MSDNTVAQPLFLEFLFVEDLQVHDVPALRESVVPDQFPAYFEAVLDNVAATADGLEVLEASLLVNDHDGAHVLSDVLVNF